MAGLEINVTPRQGQTPITITVGETYKTQNGNEIDFESFLSDNNYSIKEQQTYDEALQEAIQAAIDEYNNNHANEEKIDYSMQYSMTWDSNDIEIETTSEITDPNVEETDETGGDETPATGDTGESNETQATTPQNALDLMTEYTKEINNDESLTDEQRAEKIKEKKLQIVESLFPADVWKEMNDPWEVDPSDDFLSAIDIDEDGNYSIDLSQQGERPYELRYPWHIMTNLYNGNNDSNSSKAAAHPSWYSTRTYANEVGKAWEVLLKGPLSSKEVSNEVTNNLTTPDTKEVESDTPANDTTTEGNLVTQGGGNPDATTTLAQGGTIAPPSDTEVDLTLSDEDADAEGMNVKIGEKYSVALASKTEKNDNGGYQGTTANGSQYVFVTPNEDGSVTVTYYDGGSEPADDATPAKTIQYNKDGSTIETTIDTDGNETETRTSADGQSTSVVRDDQGTPTKVTINQESYGTDGRGNWYKLGEDDKPVVNDDGYPKFPLVKAPVINEDGSIIITQGNESNPYIRTYNSDGSLKTITVADVDYDMSEYKTENEGNSILFTKLTSSDGENKESIKIDKDGTITIQVKIDGKCHGEKYDSSGKLVNICPVGEDANWLQDFSSYEYNEADKSYSKNGVTYIKNADGTYSLKKSYNPVLNNNTLTIGDVEIEFSENSAITQKATDGKITYFGETSDGYAVVTTDCNGNTSAEYYENEAAYNSYINKEEGASGPSKTTKYNSDGSKTETETSTTETDDNDNTTTTTKTTTIDSNGNETTQEITETKDDDGNVVEQTVISTSADNQTISYKINNSDMTEITFGGVTYTWDEEMNGYCNPNKDIKLDEIDIDATSNKFVIKEGDTIKTYNFDGSLAKINIGGTEYDMSQYKYSNGTYTRTITTDGKYTQTITINENGDITIKSNQPNENENDTVKYNKDGKIVEYNIDGKTYKYNESNELCLYENGEFKDPVEVDGPDRWGRYSIKENKEESEE